MPTDDPPGDGRRDADLLAFWMPVYELINRADRIVVQIARAPSGPVPCPTPQLRRLLHGLLVALRRLRLLLPAVADRPTMSRVRELMAVRHQIRGMTALAEAWCGSRGLFAVELDELHRQFQSCDLMWSSFSIGAGFTASVVANRTRLAQAVDAVEGWVLRVLPQIDEADGGDDAQYRPESGEGGPGQDGIYPPRRLRLGGQDYELTEQQVRIWQFFAAARVAPLERIMARQDPSAVWRERFAERKLGKVRKALSELSQKLVAAGVSFHICGGSVEMRSAAV